MKKEQNPLCREHVERAIEECKRIINILERVYPGLDAANAEIRRLQEENKFNKSKLRHSEAIRYENRKDYEQIMQQLADAPTWGDWMDAKKEMGEDKPGIYDFERKDESTYIAVKLHDGYWGSAEKLNDNVDNQPVRFRRLNYEPKPAREVEKTYRINMFGDQESLSLREIAERCDADDVDELARDLIAEKAKSAALEAVCREIVESAPETPWSDDPNISVSRNAKWNQKFQIAQKLKVVLEATNEN